MKHVDARKSEEATVALEADADGILHVPGYQGPKTNEEAYSISISDRDFIKDVVTEMESCGPMRMMLAQIPWIESRGPDLQEYTDELERLLKAAPPGIKKEIAANVRRWLGAAPDWDHYAHYRVPCDGSEAAFELLLGCDPDQLETLGIELVDGPCPGNDARYARLGGSIERANSIAVSAGLPYRFFSSK